jgi:hypothetical protein
VNLCLNFRAVGTIFSEGDRLHQLTSKPLKLSTPAISAKIIGQGCKPLTNSDVGSWFGTRYIKYTGVVQVL